VGLEVTGLTILALSGFAFLAGFIDAIVGGGGLIQLPALFVLMPGFPPATILGTSKFSGTVGALASAITYSRRIKLDWRDWLPGVIGALVCSFLGARVASLIPASTFRPIVIVALLIVGAFTLARKDFGSSGTRTTGKRLPIFFVGSGIGFYDGIFGPGTGSFMVFALASSGLAFLEASATTKFLNFSSNLSALVYFAWTGHVFYAAAIPMACCNILGSILGARLALARGSGFIRAVFLVVVTGLLGKLIFDTVRNLI
jgi:uncharacterized protein